jgi:hypothetical protein
LCLPAPVSVGTARSCLATGRGRDAPSPTGHPGVGPGASIVTETNVSPEFLEPNQTHVDLDESPSPGHRPGLTPPITDCDRRGPSRPAQPPPRREELALVSECAIEAALTKAGRRRDLVDAGAGEPGGPEPVTSAPKHCRLVKAARGLATRPSYTILDGTVKKTAMFWTNRSRTVLALAVATADACPRLPPAPHPHAGRTRRVTTYQALHVSELGSLHLITEFSENPEIALMPHSAAAVPFAAHSPLPQVVPAGCPIVAGCRGTPPS